MTIGERQLLSQWQQESPMTFPRACSLLLGTIIVSPGLLFAQFDPMAPPASQPGRPPTPGSPATQDSGPNAGDVGQVMEDKMFLRKAAEGGIAEVKLGQLALQKAGSDDVKAFAQKMVDDHTKMNNEMAQVADSMGVPLPKTMNKDDQAEYDKLKGLSGNDFDTEYLTCMVKDHHKDLHEFRMEAANGRADATLHDAVVNAESVIHDHTVMVDKLARAKGIPIPAHAKHPPATPSL
jgi:putative membrane protein